MNSLDYYGYAKLSYLSEAYIANHHKKNDGYSVVDSDGLPLFGLVADGEPTHSLQVIKDVKYA